MSHATDKPVITRFAPSPTGALHVGGARTALFNWAFAKGRGGQFMLRIEDTDLARSSDESTRGILRDLEWLGIDWDNKGSEPRQSERLAIYEEHLDRLAKADRAYKDGDAWRFRMPDKEIVVHDEVLGEVRVPRGQTEDFIIRKGEAGGRMPTYHFAVVIDDALMGVSHVIRGQEHLSNTPKHVALQEALGFERPTYAHIPLIFNPDGSKMSKRDKAKAARKAALDTGANARGLLSAGFTDEQVQAFLDKQNDELAITIAIAQALNVTLPEIDVSDFRASGYLPGALVNYLALLGWNPGGDVEKFDGAFLVKNFSLDRVGKSNSKFDRDKLFRFNADAIAALPPEVFRDQMREHFEAVHPEYLATLTGHAFDLFAEVYRPRARTLSEPAQLGRFFIVDDHEIKYDNLDKNARKAIEKNDGQGLKLLAAFRDVLANECQPWSGQKAHELLQSFCEREGAGMGAVAQPIRVAVSGGTVTPGIDQTLEILGRERTLQRIDNCLSALR